MRKVISVICCVILFFTTFLSANAEIIDSGDIDFNDIVRRKLGDINTDSQVNSMDITQLRKNFLSSAEISYNKVSDLNCDSVVDIRDLVRFKKKLSGIVVSYFEEDANELKSSILNYVGSDTTGHTGKTIYVASNGTSGFSNNSASNPCSWDNFLKWNGATSGSAASLTTVLFKRGDVFRGEFIAKEGYYYGAYGEGEKPIIYGSKENYNNAQWLVENGLYTLTFNYDIGNIFFDADMIAGVKKNSMDEVENTFDFFCEKTTVDEEAVYKLYLKLDKAPSEYESIEIGTSRNIIHITEDTSNVTIENLSLKCGGGHGIRAYGNNNNVAIRYCEISFIGGSYIEGYKDGTTRFGNGVEFYKGCDNVTVSNCYIHDIYDSGITHQGSGSYVAHKISFVENLIENCGMGSIEYWLSYSGEDTNYADNVTYADNIMRFAGYGFGGEQRADKHMSAHIQSNGNNQNAITNFVISGNIFDISTAELINIVSTADTYPRMHGNTYAQNTDGLLGTYEKNTSIIFDIFADDYISRIFKEDGAIVCWY